MQVGSIVGDHPTRFAIAAIATSLYVVALVASRGGLHRWLRRPGLRSPVPLALASLGSASIATAGWAADRQSQMVLWAILGLVVLAAALFAPSVVEASNRVVASARRAIQRLAENRGSPSERLGSSDRIGFALLSAALAALAVRYLMVASDRQVVLIGDEARFAAQSFRSWSDRPLVGVLTTSNLFGGRNVSQPGPLEAYLMSPFVRAWGIDVGARTFALVVNCGSVLLATLYARRSGGRGAAIVIAVMMLLVPAVTFPGHLTDALNVAIVVMPGTAAYVLAWALARGRTSTIPWLVAICSFVVQTHVGYAIPVLAAVIAGAALAAARRQRGEMFPNVDIHLWAGGLLLAVLWLPPTLDQLFGTGNLLRYIGIGLPSQGVSGILPMLGTISNVGGALQPSIWESSDVHRGDLQLLIVALAAGGILIRRRQRSLGVIVVATVAGGALVGALRPPTDTAAYHLYFIKPISLLAIAAVVIALVSPAGPTTSWVERTIRVGSAVFAVAALILVVEISEIWRPAPGTPDQVADQAATRDLTRQMQARFSPEDPVRLFSRGGGRSHIVTEAVLAHLSTERMDVRRFSRPVPDAVVLILTAGASDADATGPVVAEHVPPRTKRLRSTPGQLIAFLAEADPIDLQAVYRSNLIELTDGASPELCIESLGNSPEAMLKLPDEVITSIVAFSELDGPALPDALRNELYEWRNTQPLRLRQLRPELAGKADPSALILSESAC